MARCGELSFLDCVSQYRIKIKIIYSKLFNEFNGFRAFAFRFVWYPQFVR